MSLEEDFQKAAEEVKNLASQPTDADLLELYGYFKQATVGVCNTAQPGIFSYKERAKWNAWSNVKTVDPDEAKKRYIAKVNELISSLGKK